MKLWRDLDGDRRRAFGAVLVAIAVSSTGFGAIFPVLPLLVTGRGDTVGTVAAMASAFIVAGFAFQYPMAYLADRFGRRGAFGVALVAQAGLCLLYVLHLPPVGLVAVRVLQGIGMATVQPVAAALVSDLVSDERRGEAYGAVASADMLGILIGPLLGGGIAAILPLEYVFVLQAGLTLVAGLTFLYLTRGGVVPASTAPAAGENPLAGLRIMLRAELIGLGLIVAADTYLFGLYDTVWVLFMQKLGADAAMTGLTITMFAVPLLVVSPFAGRLGDRVGRRLPAILGTLGVGVIAGLYPLMPGIAAVIALGLVEGTVFAFIRPNLYALIAASAPPGMEARTQAAAGAVGIAGTLIAPALAAFFWVRDYHLTFYTGSAVVLTLTVVGGIVVLRHRVPERHVEAGLMPALPGEPRSPAAD